MAKEEVIGSPRRSLVFETVGSIRVKVGDKYYPLKYDKTEVNKDDTEPEDSRIIITNNISDYESGLLSYPGDGKIIFALNDGIYSTLDGKYNNYNTAIHTASELKTNEFTETVVFKGNPAFSVDNTTMINKLNANYFEGHSWKDVIELVNSSIKTNKPSTDLKNETQYDWLEVGDLTVKNLTFDNISGNIVMSSKLMVQDAEIIYDDYCGHGVDLITPLYYLWKSNGVDLEALSDEFVSGKTFPGFIRIFLEGANHDYTGGVPSTYTEHPDDFDTQLVEACSTEDMNDNPGNLYWQLSERTAHEDFKFPKSISCIPLSEAIEIFNSIQDGGGDDVLSLPKTSNIYNEVFSKIYFMTEEDKAEYIGPVVHFKLSAGSVSPGMTGSFQLTETNKDSGRTTDFMEDFIITAVSGSDVYGKLNRPITFSSELQTVETPVYLTYWTETAVGDNEDGSPKNTYQKVTALNKVLPEDGGRINVSINPKTVSVTVTTTTVLGSVSMANDALLNPTGIGLYSNNCYLMAPKIGYYTEEKKNYIMFDKSRSFLGLNSQNGKWISIESDTQGTIDGYNYKIKSDGTIKIKDWLEVTTSGDCSLKHAGMYNFNTTGICTLGPISVTDENSCTIGPIKVTNAGSCTIGPITVSEDGSCTIGKLTVYKDGSIIIGSGDTAISVSEDGEVSVPEGALPKSTEPSA